MRRASSSVPELDPREGHVAAVKEVAYRKRLGRSRPAVDGDLRRPARRVIGRHVSGLCARSLSSHPKANHRNPAAHSSVACAKSQFRALSRVRQAAQAGSRPRRRGTTVAPTLPAWGARRSFERARTSWLSSRSGFRSAGSANHACRSEHSTGCTCAHARPAGRRSAATRRRTATRASMRTAADTP